MGRDFVGRQARPLAATWHSGAKLPVQASINPDRFNAPTEARTLITTWPRASRSAQESGKHPDERRKLSQRLRLPIGSQISNEQE